MACTSVGLASFMRQIASLLGRDEKIVMGSEYFGPDWFGASLRLSMVDLSHPISPSMPVWPGDPPPQFQSWAELDRDGYYLRRLSMSEHGGTHLTAPASFYDDGLTVDRIPSEDLVKPSVMIDVRQQCQADRDYTLSVHDLLAWEEVHGRTPAGTIALLYTGWADRWNDPSSYLGAAPGGRLHFPGFGADAASLLIEDRSVAGLGTDTPGLEPGIDCGFTVSRLVLSHSRIVLENLTNLQYLPPTGAVLVIGLLKLEGGSGSPAAVTALVPSS